MHMAKTGAYGASIELNADIN